MTRKRAIPKEAYVGLFAAYDSVPEAMQRASSIINAMDANSRVAATTAVQCLINTVIKEETKLEEQDDND